MLQSSAGRYLRYFGVSRYQILTIPVSWRLRYLLVARNPKYRDTFDDTKYDIHSNILISYAKLQQQKNFIEITLQQMAHSGYRTTELCIATQCNFPSLFHYEACDVTHLQQHLQINFVSMNTLKKSTSTWIHCGD